MLISLERLVHANEEFVGRQGHINLVVTVVPMVTVCRRAVVGRGPQLHVPHEQLTLPGHWARQPGTAGNTAAIRAGDLVTRKLGANPTGSGASEGSGTVIRIGIVGPIEGVVDICRNRNPIVIVDHRLREVALLVLQGGHTGYIRLTLGKSLAFPREIEEGMVLAVVEMRDPDRASYRGPVIVLVKGLSRIAERIVGPVVAIQVLIAEIKEHPAVVLICAALGLHGDQAAGVTSFVGGQNAAFHAKLTDRIRCWNGTIGGVEFRLLHLVSVHADAGPVHLAARDRVTIAGVGD